jgi:hypothetical protein
VVWPIASDHCCVVWATSFQALDDAEADDELLAALHNLPVRSLLASEAAAAAVPGTPQCFGKYSSGQTYPRDCCESCNDCINMVQVRIHVGCCW